MAAELDSELRTAASSAAFETPTFGEGVSGKADPASAGSGRTDAATLLAAVTSASVLRGLSEVSVQQRSASIVISKVHLKDRTGARATGNLPSLYCTLGQDVTGPLVMSPLVLPRGTPVRSRDEVTAPPERRSIQSEQESC